MVVIYGQIMHFGDSNMFTVGFYGLIDETNSMRMIAL